MRNRIYKRIKAFTLAEAMIAMVILSIATAGIVLPFAAGTAVRSEGRHRTLGAKLAGDLMEKIINTSYADIVGTYNGYNESQGQVTDAAGSVFSDSNYTEFSRDVTCEYVRLQQQQDYTEPIFIKAVVRVYYKGSQMAEVTRLIGH